MQTTNNLTLNKAALTVKKVNRKMALSTPKMYRKCQNNNNSCITSYQVTTCVMFTSCMHYALKCLSWWLNTVNARFE